MQIKYVDDKLFIIGDFNLSRICWTHSDNLDFTILEPARQYVKKAAHDIKESFMLLNCKQFFPPLSGKGYSLDLLFSNSIVSWVKSGDNLVRCDDHHKSAFFAADVEIENCNTYDETFYNFKRANFNGLNDSLSEIEWQYILGDTEIQPNVEKFYNVIEEAISKNVPKIRLKSDYYPCWYNSELKQLVGKKKEAHKVYKESFFTL